MYTIHADGELFYAPNEPALAVLNPRLSLNIDQAGRLSFILPPSHPRGNRLEKMKTVLTVEQDGVELFRGRIFTEETDYYKQRSIECEGERAFLIDSIQRPYTFEGTAEGLLRQLVAVHNTQVGEEKRFTVGTVSATRAQETVSVESDSYTTTSTEIEQRILNVYGGHLRTRGQDGQRFIDWIQSGATSQQEIRFSVNLLDLEDQANAAEVFTVLIPLGKADASGGNSKPLTIESVNGGRDFIEDPAAIARFGRITKVYQWNQVEDAAVLLQRGREYLREHGPAIQTLTLQAVDMHLLDAGSPILRLGDHVRILSEPHGIDRTTVCAAMELDMVNPENTRYTFGTPPKTLTDAVAKAEQKLGGGGGGRSLDDQVEEVKEWSKIYYNETVGHIDLLSGVVDDQQNQIEQAGIRIDGLNAAMELKVSKDGVVSAINLSPEEIVIKAGKVNIAGATVIQNLQADIANFNKIVTGSASAEAITVNRLSVPRAGSFNFQGARVGLYTVQGTDGKQHSCLGVS